MFNRSKAISIASVLLLISSFLIPDLVTNAAHAVSDTAIASMYVDAPFVQGSYAVNYGGITETFDNLPVGMMPDESGDSQTAIGYISQGVINVGPSGSPFGSITATETPTVDGPTTQFGYADSTGFTITFSTPVKYVGFWWAAGNAGNTVTLYSRGTEVASMDTTQLSSLLGSVPDHSVYPTNSDALTSIGENVYLKKYYFGNPGYFNTQTPVDQGPEASVPREPFAYVHSFANNGQSFDKIKFSGSGYEMDNITVSTQNVPVSNSLVFLSDIEANCTRDTYDEGGGTTTIRFTGNFCLFNAPSGVSNVNIVAVGGGGGGGGTCVGGGGGAGGYYRKENQVVTGVIEMRIGAPGTGGTGSGCNTSPGTNGGDTELTYSGIVKTIHGGGGGGSFYSVPTGLDGASGGGGSGDGNPVHNWGGTGISGEGSDGGSGYGGISGNPAGGGGGYSGVGLDGSPEYGGDGGDGISLNIFGGLQHFSGGGGGSSDSHGGLGGESCGGNGAGPNSGEPSTVATGYGCGGGGGDGGYEGADGSAGVVFITYTIQDVLDVSSCAGAGSLINGDFENLPSGVQEATDWWQYDTGYWHGYTGAGAAGDPRQILFLYDQSDPDTLHSTLQLSGWNTTEGDHNLEIQRQVSGYAQDGNQTGGGYVDYFNGAPASGNYYAELNANSASTLYQMISTIPGTTIRWSLKHRGRLFSWDTVDTMHVRIGTDFDNAAVQTGDPGNGNVQKFPSMPGSEYSTPIFSDTPIQVDAYGAMSDSLDSGWSLYTGSYLVPAGQTQTLFAFESDDGWSSLGNYLDDIKFSPLIACPASITVVAGRTALVNPFDINSNGNALANDPEDSYGWSNAFVTSAATADGSITRTSLGGVANRAFRYTAPSTPGTYSIEFMIGNPQGDLSRSHYAVTVLPNPKLRAPSDIPVDPRTENYKFGLSQVTTANSDVLACIQQSDSRGVSFTGSLRFDVATSGAIDHLITTSSGDVTVTSDRTENLILRGRVSAINEALKSLNLYRSGSSPRLSTVMYIKLSSVVTGLLLYEQSNCSDARASQIKVIRIKPIKLTQTRSFTIVPKNGRQNN